MPTHLCTGFYAYGTWPDSRSGIMLCNAIVCQRLIAIAFPSLLVHAHVTIRRLWLVK